MIEVIASMDMPLEEQLVWWGRGAGWMLGYFVIVLGVRVFRKLACDRAGLE